MWCCWTRAELYEDSRNHPANIFIDLLMSVLTSWNRISLTTWIGLLFCFETGTQRSAAYFVITKRFQMPIRSRLSYDIILSYSDTNSPPAKLPSRPFSDAYTNPFITNRFQMPIRTRLSYVILSYSDTNSPPTSYHRRHIKRTLTPSERKRTSIASSCPKRNILQCS